MGWSISGLWARHNPPHKYSVRKGPSGAGALIAAGRWRKVAADLSDRGRRSPCCRLRLAFDSLHHRTTSRGNAMAQGAVIHAEHGQNHPNTRNMAPEPAQQAIPQRDSHRFRLFSTTGEQVNLKELRTPQLHRMARPLALIRLVNCLTHQSSPEKTSETAKIWPLDRLGRCGVPVLKCRPVFLFFSAHVRGAWTKPIQYRSKLTQTLLGVAKSRWRCLCELVCSKVCKNP